MAEKRAGGSWGSMVAWGVGVVVIVAGGWGVWKLVRSDGGGRQRFAVPEGTSVQDAPPVDLGRRLFTTNCAVCHRESGEGVAGAYPPLRGSEWVAGEPARLKRIVLHGMEGSVQAGGKTFAGVMPPFERLRDEQIAAVLTYIRSAWGNGAEEVTPQSVAATPAAIRQRMRPWTAEELAAIERDDPRAAASGDGS